MSRRNEIQFTAEELASFLSQPHKAALATVDKEGFPHVVAMGYRYLDGVIYMTSYGKAQKVVNVRRNPKVAVMVEVGERYADFRGVMIRGYCEVIEDPKLVNETMRLAGESATAAAVPSGGGVERTKTRRPQNQAIQNCQLGPQAKEGFDTPPI
jgi:nitroimidazol reductase NimA-like FMN-containing flavoprotein (pyridoxamine 5'-phosphate oxidase superfamily)